MRHIRRFAVVATVLGVTLMALAATQPGRGGSAAAAGLAQAPATPTPSPRPEPPGQHAPTAHDGDANAPSGATLENISLEGRDADFCGGGQSFSISIVTLPPHGTLSNQDWPGTCQDQPADGWALLVTTFDYTSDADFVGTDTITFAYSDGFATGNVATFTVHVQAGEPSTPTPTLPGPPTPRPTLPGTRTPTPTLPGTPPPVGDPTPVATPTAAAVTRTPTATPGGDPTPMATVAAASPPPTPTPTPTPTSAGQSAAPTPALTPPPPVLGNWDCDSSVTLADALRELRYLAALSVTQHEPCPDIGTEMVATWGDVDCDGHVTSLDVLKILRHIAGLPVSQTEPCADIGGPLA